MAQPAHKVDAYIEELTAPGELSEFRIRSLIFEMKKALKSAGDANILALLHTALGIAYAQLEDEDEAVQHHRAAIRQSGHHGHVHNFAVTLTHFGRLAEALERGRAADELAHGQDPAVLGHLAVVLVQLGRTAEAREELQRAVKVVSQDNPTHLLQLARNAAAVGLSSEAVELLARAIAVSKGIAMGNKSAFDIFDEAPDMMHELAAEDLLLQHAIMQRAHWRDTFAGFERLATLLPSTSAAAPEDEAETSDYLKIRPFIGRALVAEEQES